MVGTGFDIVLSDFASNAEAFVKAIGGTQLVRRNISPILIENDPENELAEQVQQAMYLAKDCRNVIIGTGVLSYNTPVENILKVKQMVQG